MHRLRRRPTLRPPTDEEICRDLAAQLVGLRIITGLTPAEMLERIGYRYSDAPREEKRGLDEKRWAVYKLALIEHAMADEEGRLSTIQRYTRALQIGTRIRVRLYSDREMHKLEARRRMRRIAARKRNKKAGRFPPL